MLSRRAAEFYAAGRLIDSEQAARAVLAQDARHWPALANLAQALHAQDRIGDAVPLYIAALNINPGAVAAWSNLGVALRDQWRMPGSLDAHAAALALAPQDPQIRANRAMALLTAGEYREGFAEFAWRWRCPGMRPHGIAGPEWQGNAARGRTILLHAEGGFGDTLQFARYAPRLAAAGADVILRVQRPLLRLLARSFPALRVIPDDAALPPYECHCPLMSLPAAMGTTLQNVPAAPGYLRARPGAAAAWRARLEGAAPGAALRVGVVWQGSPHLGAPELRSMNARRSMPGAALAPLASIAGVALVSLQLGAPPSGLPLCDAMAGMADFDDTAALVAALDLVIGVDTAVIHLAGALGRPVWVLSRHDACWRWLAHRSDSPWYPGLRLYRQARPGDWEGIVAQAAADLAALVTARS